MDGPTHCAVKNEHVDCLRLFKDAKVDLEGVNNKQETPVHLAAKSNSKDSLQILKDLDVILIKKIMKKKHHTFFC